MRVIELKKLLSAPPTQTLILIIDRKGLRHQPHVHVHVNIAQPYMYTCSKGSLLVFIWYYTCTCTWLHVYLYMYNVCVCTCTSKYCVVYVQCTCTFSLLCFYFQLTSHKLSVRPQPSSHPSDGAASQTARKILDTLHSLSSPLHDARKLPLRVASVCLSVYPSTLYCTCTCIRAVTKVCTCFYQCCS